MASASVAYDSGRFLRVGDVIGRAFGVWRKIVWPCGAIYAVALAPGLVNSIAVQQHKLAPQDVFGWRYWGIGLVAGLFGLMVRAIVTQASAQAVDDGAMRLTAAIDAGVGRMLPLLGMWILAVLALMLASLLLIVPGVMLWTAWFVITPVCVLERQGPVASMKRSAALTRGNRWRIFGLMLVLFVVGGIAAAIPIVGAKLALGAAGAAVVQVVAQALAGVFGTVVAVVAYQDLRAAQEGVGGGRLAAVFD